MRRRLPLRGPARALAAIVAVLLALAGTAAGQDKLSLPDRGIEITAHSEWPVVLSKGFVPVLIHVENTGEDDRLVELIASSRMWDTSEQSARRRVFVPAGRSTDVEMFTAVLSRSWGYGATCALEVRVDGRHQQIWGVPHFQSESEPHHPVLVLAPEAPALERVEEWAETLSEALDKTEGAEGSKASVAAVPFARTPRRLEGYSSLDAVVVDCSAAVPPAILEPVLTWARLGGIVLFHGPHAARVAGEMPGVTPWLEERFLLARDGGVSIYRMGQGRVAIAPSEEILDPGPTIRALAFTLVSHWSEVPASHPSARRSFWPAIPGLGELPYRVLTVLLVLFAILIGPVNFLVVKASGKPSLLLVTIPLLALLATAAILSYGIFYQGIDVRSASHTHTVLDQREHHAATIEKRSFFAGLAPARGLLPRAGTLCFPDSIQLSGGGTSLFEIDLDSGPRWSRDYLPVRRQVAQTLLVDRTARARLEVERRDDSLAVTNALGEEILLLAVRDPRGGWYVTSDTLAPNGTALLPATESSEMERLADRMSDLAWTPGEGVDEETLPAVHPHAPRPFHPAPGPLEWLTELWPAGYVAVLARNPFVDDCGVESEELHGVHFVYGVLDPEAEGWR